MTQTAEAPELDLTTPEGALAYREWGQAYPDLWIENLLNCSMWAIPRAIARSVFDRSKGQTKRTVAASCTSSFSLYLLPVHCYHYRSHIQAG